MGAGDWIKLRCNVLSDSRIIAIGEKVGAKDNDIIVAKVVRLWIYADQHTVDGFIPFATPATIDTILGMKGIAAAIAGVGWLEFSDAGAIIPRFEEHNGESAKRRAADAKRKASSRGKGNGPTGDPPNGGIMSDDVRTERGQPADEVRTVRGRTSELDQDQNQRRSDLKGRSSKPSLLVGAKRDGPARVTQIQAHLTLQQHAVLDIMQEIIPDAEHNPGQLVVIARTLTFQEACEVRSETNESRHSPNKAHSIARIVIDACKRKCLARNVILFDRSPPHRASAATGAAVVGG